ncbi:MAG: DUF998 domain-containing protein [Actinobacteria bacterium]|nr:DUF998 domain-containing protein [Actinomycetota bacterium]
MPFRRSTRLGLWAGVLVPVIYFGVQLWRAPAVPGYSFRRDAASDLGAAGVPGAVWFNVAAVASGIAAVLAAVAWWDAPRAWGVGRLGRGFVCGALTSIGAASIAAGWFPLPDDRHGGGPVGIGLFALPILLVFAIARRSAPGWVRVYVVANAALFVVAALMFSGATWLDPTVDEGVMQRVLACSVFVPIGVLSAAALAAGRRRDGRRRPGRQVTAT